MKKPLSVILVEDMEDDAALILRELKRGGYEVTWRRVEDTASFERALVERSWDVVLSDWAMPQLGALRALEVVKKLRCDIPFIIVSGTVGDAAAFEAMRSGAKDYVLKDALARLVPAIERELTERENKKAQERILRQTEDQLRQAQKMEAIGALAGGVAHDFNNILSVILGYGTILLDDMQPNEPRREEIQQIVQAARRAASLTRQLLAFSRQQVLEPKLIDLNETIAQLGKMIPRLVSEDITVETSFAPNLWTIKVDPSQIEQVLMNLVVNARDAMPQGGTLRIATQNVEMDERYSSEIGATPGPYVMLAVQDNGIGMDRETQTRIFEPFFTTKEKGKGTGLGLSTVFGIVRQSGGHIFVCSDVGAGTELKVFFPRSEGERRRRSTEMQAVTVKGKERILLVEDEPQVRKLTRAILKRAGYDVIDAESAKQALELCTGLNSPIDLLLTDVVMLQMSGRELAQAFVKTRPDVKVLFMSGYTDDTIVRHGVFEAGVHFLQKPLTPEALTRKIREVLDSIDD